MEGFVYMKDVGSSSLVLFAIWVVALRGAAQGNRACKQR